MNGNAPSCSTHHIQVNAIDPKSRERPLAVLSHIAAVVWEDLASNHNTAALLLRQRLEGPCELLLAAPFCIVLGGIEVGDTKLRHRILGQTHCQLIRELKTPVVVSAFRSKLCVRRRKHGSHTGVIREVGCGTAHQSKPGLVGKAYLPSAEAEDTEAERRGSSLPCFHALMMSDRSEDPAQ